MLLGFQIENTHVATDQPCMFECSITTPPAMFKQTQTCYSQWWRKGTLQVGLGGLQAKSSGRNLHYITWEIVEYNGRSARKSRILTLKHNNFKFLDFNT